MYSSLEANILTYAELDQPLKEHTEYDCLVSKSGKVYEKRGDVYLQRSVWLNRYPCVRVTRKLDGIVVNRRLHRLLAECWIPNPNNYEVVHHKDHDKLNYDLSNLEWTTKSGNAKEAYKFYNKPLGNAGKFGGDNACAKPVLAVVDGKLVGQFATRRDAAKHFGVHQTTVTNSIKKQKPSNIGVIFLAA